MLPIVVFVDFVPLHWPSFDFVVDFVVMVAVDFGHFGRPLHSLHCASLDFPVNLQPMVLIWYLLRVLLTLLVQRLNQARQIIDKGKKKTPRI